MDSIKILSEPSEAQPFAVVFKTAGLPSAPISADDKNNALIMAINQLPQIKNVCGRKEIEYGLLHRLDTVTEGLILIATTQDFYDFMEKEQQEGRFEKFYRAVCLKNKNVREIKEGFPETMPFNPNDKTPYAIESYFRNFGPGKKEVRPVLQNDKAAALKKTGKAKIYRTFIENISDEGDFFGVECRITEGYRHQVRCHLAWKGLPIKNDLLYNPFWNKNDNEKICFSAFKIRFNNPVTNKVEVFQI